jgi:hypothetical protein
VIAANALRTLSLTLSLVAVALFGAKTALAADPEPGTWDATYDRPAVEVGGYIADDGGSGEINVLAPLMFSEGKDLLFLGVDAKVFVFDPNDVDDTAYNVGAYLGYRTVLNDGGGVLGLWGGLDHMRTEESNEFFRAIAGVEYFGQHFIGRANAFVPLDSTSDEWSVRDGNFINTYDEKIPSGFDAEIGLRLAVPMDTLARSGEFRVFAGGYDFIGLDDDGDDVFGGRLRAELDLYPFQDAPNTRVSLEAAYAFDKYSGDQFGGGIKISIPLGITNKIETSHAKDAQVVTLESFGQDLFQPVRRNREPVSRIRLKDRRPVAGGITGNVLLSNICGGARGSLSLNGGLNTTSVKQGALLGVIDPGGTNKQLFLQLSTMVAPDGRTLKQIIDSKPDVLVTTLKFAPGTVDFTSDAVAPVEAVGLVSSPLAGQRITDATVTIDGPECSLDLTVQPAVTEGLTLARVCGGPNANIDLNAGLQSSTIRQGATIGVIDPAGGATALELNIANMVSPTGQTLEEALASKPKTLNSTFTFASSTVDFTAQSVRPAEAFSKTTSAPVKQTIKSATLTVNSLSCSFELEIEESDPQPDGLTLATICGGPDADIALNSGLATSRIKRGAALGIIDPTGAATALNLDIAEMVAPGGSTLAELLSSKPQTLSSTFTFTQTTVNFATQIVQPAAAVALSSGTPANQLVKSVTLTVNSTSCSLSVDVENKLDPDDGLTLAKMCGGPNGNIALNSGLATTRIRRGASLGIIDPTGAATTLSLDIADMVAPNGSTLSELLASKPKTLSSTFTFSQSTVNFATQTVQPSAAVALASGAAANQLVKGVTLTVNNTSCSLNVDVENKPDPDDGLTLATICGGPGTALPMRDFHGSAIGAKSIQDGDRIGTIVSRGSAPLSFNLAKMVDENGTSLTQLLASRPKTLTTTLYLPASTVVLSEDIVEPAPDLAVVVVDLIKLRLLRFYVNVNSTSCSVVVKNGIKPTT